MLWQLISVKYKPKSYIFFKNKIKKYFVLSVSLITFIINKLFFSVKIFNWQIYSQLQWSSDWDTAAHKRATRPWTCKSLPSEKMKSVKSLLPMNNEKLWRTECHCRHFVIKLITNEWQNILTTMSNKDVFIW